MDYTKKTEILDFRLQVADSLAGPEGAPPRPAGSNRNSDAEFPHIPESVLAAS
jgi:hypothetical protein